MKKVLVILIVLVVLGGVVFYFGWVQIRLPGDACAVIFTRTGGFDRKVTMPGTFSWRWERLLPRNLTLYRYSLAPHRTRVEVKLPLPSAELYSAVLPEKPDFSIQAVAELEFALRPESIPELLREKHLYPEALQEYYRGEAEALASALTEAARSAAVLVPGAQAALRDEVAGLYPHLSILRLELRELRMPDSGRFLKPLDHATLDALAAEHRLLVTVEDGLVTNGFGASLAALAGTRFPHVRVVPLGAPDRTWEHASRASQLAEAGLTAEQIAVRTRELLAAAHADR